MWHHQGNDILSVAANCVGKLNEKSASGPDLLPPILLKNIALTIASLLASIFELFFINSFLPMIWKLSYVKPISRRETPH